MEGGPDKRAGGRGREEELLRALGGFSVVVPHKCIQALQDEPLTGMRDGEHERRRRRRKKRHQQQQHGRRWSVEPKSARRARHLV